MQATRTPLRSASQRPSFARPAAAPSTRRLRVQAMSGAGEQAAAAAGGVGTATQTIELRKLTAVPISAEAFAPFGQVVGYSDDGKMFDREDAQLQGFDAGIPRFYVMRLPRRGTKFHRITYHAKVTQCLGVLAPVGHWYMVVARPSGSVANYPKEEDLMAFKIPHGVFVKMEKGTWHAGPLFDEHPHMDFYNLELSDTNVTDHNTHDYKKVQGWEFEVEEADDVCGSMCEMDSWE